MVQKTFPKSRKRLCLYRRGERGGIWGMCVFLCTTTTTTGTVGLDESMQHILWRQTVFSTAMRGADVDTLCCHFLWLNAGNRSIIVQCGWLQVVLLYSIPSEVLLVPPLLLHIFTSVSCFNQHHPVFFSFLLVLPRWQSLSCQQPLLRPSICSISLVASTYRCRQRKKPWGSEKVSALSETRRKLLCAWTANSSCCTMTRAAEFRPLGTLHLQHSTGLC